MRFNPSVCIAFVAIVTASCNNKPSTKDSGVPERTVFFDKSGMDTTVNPGDDFYRYANGKWYKETKIPASQSSWGTFNILADDNIKNLHGILDSLKTLSPAEGSKEQKIGDFYASGLDTVTIDKKGYDPIKPELAKIAAINDAQQLINFCADAYKEGSGYLFGFGVGPDDKNSNKNLAYFNQTGLGLPNREYYTKTDSASVKIRAAYGKYIAKLFILTGVDQAAAAKNAADIIKLETAIALSHSTPNELRDPVKNYHKFAVSDLQKKSGMDLNAIFSRMGFKTDTILVGQPKYFITLNTLLKSQPVALWKKQLTFMSLNSSANYLSQPFQDARFDFYGKVLNGQKVQKERWKRMTQIVDNDLGELLGQLYVDKYFTSDAKKRMLDLVNNLQTAYKDRIEKLDWMSPETKKKAIDKLNAFTKKIGYPDKWKSYDDVEIRRDTYFDNALSVSKHDYSELLKRINKPVDKMEWGMTPPTVNAYYNPSFNEIVFPAGILQFPFFDKNADDAINYGAIGAGIGHEMTHGFDDQGAQYDKNGNLKEWWTPQDAARFKTKTAAIGKQYDDYVVLKDLHVNGSLTMGENIADNGGIAIAYQAFKNTAQGKSDKKIDGLTPDQRFFLSFAQLWRSKQSDESTRMRISADPHSPDIYRVNGTLSNTEAWYKAFNIKPGDKMYKPETERIKIW
ncbi:M13 family metallopeptidase [Pedobacter hartonius]|uniref:Putative endopeptidase n=1 Tax=Pedobacter hartonius TaxID=425514 RepID=A0A1H4BM69_9SPHI|nr:M13 family metallopeptidase [Pedobacter hartonius]SEA49197.1 putative endopeptidase [Pedobacter hartonius]